ncbi:TonB-dependent receptor [Labilibacter sediminis]|nr:TonB-dependent receptor [Labilibacter sediminis]
MKKTVIFTLIYLVSLCAFAQETITGVVSGKDGETIPGVNVVLKGSSQGVITDLQGRYSFDVPKDGTLIFSFIGFKTLEVPVQGRSIVNVVLESDMESIDEVVVVGYGQMRKSDITGSVSSVRLDEANTAGGNIDALLQGRSSGVYVATNSSEPGANVNVRIRGLNSLSVSNQPLYVIDGVPYDTDINTPNAMGQNSAAPTQSPLVGLNPEDVESIEILKDASATAIYGSRGANGVVLITTKGGKNTKSQVVFSSALTFSQVTEKIDVLSAQDFARYRNEWEGVRAEEAGEEPNYPYDGSEGKPLPEDVWGYDWQDEVFRTAISQDYNLGFFGAGEKSDYYVSLGLSDNQGVVRNSSLERYSFSAKLNSELKDWIKLNTSIAYTRAEGEGTSTSGDTENITYNAISWTLRKSPIGNEWTDDEFLDPEDLEQTTPLDFVNQYISHPISNSIRGKVGLTFDVLNWLKFESSLGVNYIYNKRGQYWPSTLPMVQDKGRAGYSTSESISYTLNNLAHFNFDINKTHKISGVVGTETNHKVKDQFQVSGDGFSDDALGYFGLESASTFSPADLDREKTTLFSVLARANYSYKNKYLATVTGRYDGSSKFAETKKYGFFPSFSLAWRVSQEGFLKNNEVISNLKLRAGWGQVGNQGLPAYSSLGLYASRIYPLGGASVSGYVTEDFPKDITWETTEQVNVGTDIGVFNNRFMLSVDAYRKVSKDILQRLSMPGSSGYTTAWTNLGEIENKGIDVELNSVIFEGDFRWELGGNFSLYRNKIQKLNLPESSYGYSQFWGSKVGGFNVPVNTFIEGEPIGLFWGYEMEGIFQNEQEIAERDQAAIDAGKGPYHQFGVPQYPGDIKYKDINGDGVVNGEDNKIIGNPNPDFTYGINTTFSYKGLSLNAFFTGVEGTEVLNQNLLKMTNVSQSGNNVLSDAYFKAWRKEGDTDLWPRIQSDSKRNVLLPSDRLVEDGSYFRLSQATLSYEVPVRNISWLSGLNISAIGNNLFTITNYSWWNPETSTYGDSNSAIGIDRNSYPFSRSYTFRVRLTL